MRALHRSTGAVAAIITIAATAATINSSHLASAFATGAGSAHDTTPPVGGVGGVQSPIAPGTMHLALDATDTGGAGLASAEALMEGQAGVYVRLGNGTCPEHPIFTSGGVFDPTLAGDCPETVANVPIAVPTGGDGTHQLRVTVTDGAGSTTTLVDQPILVQAPGNGTNTIRIGIGNPGPGNGGGGSSSTGSGGVAGFTASGGGGSTTIGAGGTGSRACPSPLLTMRLFTPPVRYTKRGHIPVLLYNRRYRYRGTLTCLPTGGHHRVSAPDGTIVQALTIIGHHVLKTGRGTMTIHRGQFSAYLKYTRSVSVLFRFTEPNGEQLQVKIPIQVTRRPRAGGGTGAKGTGR